MKTKRKIREALDKVVNKILLKFDSFPPTRKARKLMTELSKRITKDVKFSSKNKAKTIKNIRKISTGVSSGKTKKKV